MSHVMHLKTNMRQAMGGRNPRCGQNKNEESDPEKSLNREFFPSPTVHKDKNLNKTCILLLGSSCIYSLEINGTGSVFNYTPAEK